MLKHQANNEMLSIRSQLLLQIQPCNITEITEWDWTEHAQCRGWLKLVLHHVASPYISALRRVSRVDCSSSLVSHYGIRRKPLRHLITQSPRRRHAPRLLANTPGAKVRNQSIRDEK